MCYVINNIVTLSKIMLLLLMMIMMMIMMMTMVIISEYLTPLQNMMIMMLMMIMIMMMTVIIISEYLTPLQNGSRDRPLFADGYPLMMLSQASLDSLNTVLEAGGSDLVVEETRFR